MTKSTGKRVLLPHTATLAERLAFRTQKTRGCWVWQGARSKKGKGHGVIGADGGLKLTHRVAWELAYGPIPKGLFVCHHCDNPPCVRPDHLFLGTNQDNIRDASRKGRLTRPLGQKHFRAVLTDAQVVAARACVAAGSGTGEIGRMLGVKPEMIWRAVTGHSYPHLPGVIRKTKRVYA